MSESNGMTVVEPEPVVRDRYRPEASMKKVNESIESALREIVSEATNQAGSFTYLARIDRDKGTAVCYGHLVDASECLETAMTYLGMLKQVLSHRLRTEDDHNLGTPEF